MNLVFRKQEKIAIIVAYYEYTTTSGDLAILWSFILRLTSLVTGTCNERVSIAKKASLHVVYRSLPVLQSFVVIRWMHLARELIA